MALSLLTARQTPPHIALKPDRTDHTGGSQVDQSLPARDTRSLA